MHSLLFFLKCVFPSWPSSSFCVVCINLSLFLYVAFPLSSWAFCCPVSCQCTCVQLEFLWSEVGIAGQENSPVLPFQLSSNLKLVAVFKTEILIPIIPRIMMQKHGLIGRTSLAFEVVFSSLGERKLETLTVTNVAVMMVVVLLCFFLSIPAPVITDHSWGLPVVALKRNKSAYNFCLFHGPIAFKCALQPCSTMTITPQSEDFRSQKCKTMSPATY